MVVWRLIVGLTVLLGSCSSELVNEAPLVAPQPTPSDWNTALKGLVLLSEGKPCLEVRRANVDDCSKELRFSLYCIDEDDPNSAFSPTTPKGCGILYTKSLDGCVSQVALGTKLKCRLDTNVPQTTPSPTPPPDPFKPCNDSDPKYCWHRDSRLSGNSCWSNCQCVLRSVGPCAGTTTPKPSPSPSPRPTSSPRPTQTPVDTYQYCVNKNPSWCWHKDSSVTNDGDCFANCVCVRTSSGLCKSTPTPGPTVSPSPSPSPSASPRPTSTPSSTQSPKPVVSPSPPISCPAGMHPVWSCARDATPSPTFTPRFTSSPRPTSTSSPRPTTTALVQGGWFIPECTTNSPSGTRVKWYNLPYVYAAYPKGFNKHATDYSESCTPNAEVWTATAVVKDHWTRPVEQNIEIVKPQMVSVITAIRERKQIIQDLTAKGVTGDKLPKMPVLWIDESSSFADGTAQDLYAGGFYDYSGGTRVLKSAKSLSPVLPGHISYMIREYQKEGVVEFAVAPYTFGWANAMLNPKLSGLSINEDLRGRRLGLIPRPMDGMLSAYSPSQMSDILTQANPDIWPKNRVWVSNPDQVQTDANHMIVDLPDDVTLKRDAVYYNLFLYALKGQFPEVTRVIGQLSNCVYNRRADSPHWAIARNMLSSNQSFGYLPEIQIEGCTSKESTDAGKQWNTPTVDCKAASAIRSFSGPFVVSMWLTDIQAGLKLDYGTCH